MASGTEVGNSPLLPLSNSAPNFEFGKRKRWADLVITELVDVLLLVLSPQGKVLYCGNGLKGLTGWKDTDIIDYDFADLLNGAFTRSGISLLDADMAQRKTRMDSWRPWRHHCAPEIQWRRFMFAYEPLPRRCPTRRRPKNSSSKLTVAPKSSRRTTIPNYQCRYFSRSQNRTRTKVLQCEPITSPRWARPTLNASHRRLDTFIDLQEEHDRLQHRVAELRARAPRSAPSSPASSSASSSTSMYATTSMVPKHPVSQSPQTYAPTSSENVSPSPASSGYDTGHFDNPGAASSEKIEDDEDPAKKKKVVPISLSFTCINSLFGSRCKRRSSRRSNMFA